MTATPSDHPQASPTDLTGQRALVTGSSRGIGRAIASSLASHGARIGLHCHHDHERARDTLTQLAGDGHVLLTADLNDPEAARDLAARAVAELGGLEILVNNAGIYEPLPLPDATPDSWYENWQRTLRINLLGPALVTLPTAQHMMNHGGGHIVNITSRGAFRGEPTAVAYGASKAGMNAMSQSLAQALAPHGISVTAVAPGYVATDMTREILDSDRGDAIRRQSPLHRVARPEEVAEVVVFLVSGRADFLTGGIVDVNGASYLRS